MFDRCDERAVGGAQDHGYNLVRDSRLAVDDLGVREWFQSLDQRRKY